MIDAPIAAAATTIGTSAASAARSPAMTPRKTRISPILSKVESMNEPSRLVWPVARASVPSNMSKTPPMKTMRPPTIQNWTPTSAAPAAVMRKPMTVSPSGVRPRRPIASAIGSKIFLIWLRDSLEIVMSASHPQYGPLPLGELVKCLGPETADRLSAPAPGLDDAGAPEATDVPRHERLRQADMGDELGDRRLTVRQPADDPEAIHVGHDLVEGAQLAQVIGLGD